MGPPLQNKLFLLAFPGVARPVLVIPWIVIQELDSLKVQNIS